MKFIEVCQELTKVIPTTRIYMNEPMKKYTSFKVGGNADILVKVKDIKELMHAVKTANRYNQMVTVIGNGSNILVKDNGIRGIVIKIEFDEINIDKQKDFAIVTVGAGVKLARLAQELLSNKITGFEFASGIPGTIGGAVKMNAGAYGGEMKDIVINTKCLKLKKENKTMRTSNIGDIEITNPPKCIDESNIVVLENKDQNFSYRNSVFSDKKYIILETKLQLSYANKKEIQEKMNEYNQARREKQPDLPSAGSTFKRGKDYITAKLIDECGLKGYKIGGAQVSEKHAGFIVNTGDATAQDIIDLINYVKKVVHEKTGKNIELEVEILGE